MIKSVVAFITVITTFFTGCFSNAFDSVLFPEVPQTESVEFAENLGNGWNLSNTLEACEKGSAEKWVSKAKFIGVTPIQQKK